MRTHYCGQINRLLIAEEVTLCGWVNRIRHHGRVVFINLRDREGIVQVVIEDDNQELFHQALKIHNEYVLALTGKARLRPPQLINQEMATGEVEVVATKITVLATAAALPFNLDSYQEEVNDELRLQYRYLDLRRKEVSDKLIFRAQAIKKIRNYFDELNFIEVETPILTKSTPEGARDFLVPSRNFPGKFYALPQSPQIFKQLLMAAGLDRYYQIVKCFRDEDLRADRQPEFTQLDVELSFADEGEIMTIHEKLLCRLFHELLNISLPQPFPKISFNQAMAKYGSDKPDLRIPLELIEVTALLKESEFTPFAAARDSKYRIAALKLPQGDSLSRKQLDNYSEFVAGYGLKGLAYIKIKQLELGSDGLQSPILKFLSNKIINELLSLTSAKNGDLIFIAAEKIEVVNEALGALRVKLGHDHGLLNSSWQPLWVVDFPMFTKTETGWTFVHHPFTAPIINNIEEIIDNPGQLKARAYDLVLNGVELGGGSIRISNYQTQLAVFKALGIGEELATERFGHLLNALKYGYPPEGGIALGVDRLIMLMSNAKSIREVIAFPKTQTGVCPLVQAPATVDEKQLLELGIKVNC